MLKVNFWYKKKFFKKIYPSSSIILNKKNVNLHVKHPTTFPCEFLFWNSAGQTLFISFTHRSFLHFELVGSIDIGMLKPSTKLRSYQSPDGEAKLNSASVTGGTPVVPAHSMLFLHWPVSHLKLPFYWIVLHPVRGQILAESQLFGTVTTLVWPLIKQKIIFCKLCGIEKI